MAIRTVFHLELTDRCNFDCAFCRPFRKHKGKQLDFDTAVRCLDVMKDRTICGAYLTAVQLNGSGEPLMYPRLEDVVVEVRKRFPMAEIVTNGSLLTEKRIVGLLNADIDMIEISLTGIIPEVYQHFQGSGIPYERCVKQLETVISNVKTLLKKREEMKKNTYIRLRYIVSKELGSYQHFKDYLEYWKDSGIDEIFTTSLWDLDRRANLEAKKPKIIRCHQMNGLIKINSDGIICPCQDIIDPDYCQFGSVYDRPLEDVVTSEEFVIEKKNRLSVDLDRVPRTCLTCEFRAYRSISDIAHNRRGRIFLHKPVKSFFYRGFWILDLLYMRLNRSDLFFKFFWAYVCRQSKKKHDQFQQKHLRVAGEHR